MKMIRESRWLWSISLRKAPAVGVPARVATAATVKIDPILGFSDRSRSNCTNEEGGGGALDGSTDRVLLRTCQSGRW